LLHDLLTPEQSGRLSLPSLCPHQAYQEIHSECYHFVRCPPTKCFSDKRYCTCWCNGH